MAGKQLKASFSNNNENILWYVVNVDMKPKSGFARKSEGV